MSNMNLVVHLTAVILATVTLTEAVKDRVTVADVDRVLGDYVSSEPPSEEQPTTVRLGMYVNGIHMDSESGTVQLSVYLRMAWRDQRLTSMFTDTEDKNITVWLSDDQIEKLWKPDVFIKNAKSSGRVNSVVNEHLCRVNQTGHVWYVIKLIVDLHENRLQLGERRLTLPIYFESFKYTTETLLLTGLDVPVDIDKTVTLSVYRLEHVSTRDCSQNYTAGTFPCYEIRFVFDRLYKESTFEWGIYLVSSMLVFISWLGFWIQPSDKRIFLGLVTSLILAVFYTAVAEWREFSYRRHSIYAQTWLIFCQALVLGMVFEYVLVYVLCGSIRDKLRRLCGASTQGEVKPMPSRCTDIVDCVCGLVVFPLVFIIFVIVFGTTTFAWE